MKLSEISQEEFIKLTGNITTLCGYPSITQDKLNILTAFLHDIHGHNTVDELMSAYRSFAAGRLDEKLESMKSLTGMSASRVLQSYLRNTKKDTNSAIPEKDSTGKDRSFVNDENKKLIFDYSGRWVTYRDELTEEEENYLMQYWVNQSKENYKKHKRPDLLTSVSYDFFIRNGTLRRSGDMFQCWTGKTYEDVCPWTRLEDGGKRLKFNEDQAIQKSKQGNFRQMMSHSAGGSLENAVKRFAVSVYFDTI